MGLTAIEKILARTSGRDVVRPGEVAVCKPDIVLHIDLPMAIEGAWYKPKKIFDTDRVIMIFDHAVPSPTIKDASAMAEGREPQKLDKDYLRTWLTSQGFTGDGPLPPIPEAVFDETLRRYVEAYETITGMPFRTMRRGPSPA